MSAVSAKAPFRLPVLMPLPPHSTPARRGFTIIEIAVILIIIALMLIIIIPHFLIEIKERRAHRVKDDLVTLNTAIEHYALDNGKFSGARVSFGDLRKYLDTNTDVYKFDGKDTFGDSYGPFIVGSRPTVPEGTEKRLEDIAGQDFWSPFQ
jgi:type II secretory pathway pseudopilin PulG